MSPNPPPTPPPNPPGQQPAPPASGARTLLVTNDFPPRPGGIQSYLGALAARMPADELVVLAPEWDRGPCPHPRYDANLPFEVHRRPGILLPTPALLRRARELAAAHRCTTVWFGAAAPLALLAEPLRAAGVSRSVACTHGHEVGWSMVPGGRQALRRIGTGTDVVTFVSRYTRSRFAAAFGPYAALEHLPSGVDTVRFAPDPNAGAEIRKRHDLGARPTIVCVSRLVPRKGQDLLIRALPEIAARVPGAALLLVGGGPYRTALRKLAAEHGVGDDVVFTGGVPDEELPAHYAAGDVFAMPCRTRGRGLDVEGLGLVYLEASACGLPVVAGRSGGAPETVRDGVTGHVVDGRDPAGLAATLAGLLADPEAAARMGAAGRDWVAEHWTWERQVTRLRNLLAG